MLIDTGSHTTLVPTKGCINFESLAEYKHLDTLSFAAAGYCYLLQRSNPGLGLARISPVEWTIRKSWILEQKLSNASQLLHSSAWTMPWIYPLPSRMRPHP